MNASEQDVVVHEVTLDGGKDLTEEAFLDKVQGSFFVSRVAELVLIQPSAEGVQRLPAKVEQLVAKGLHHVVVSMQNVGDLQNDDLKVLMQVKEVLDRCVGSLSLCNVDPGIDHRLRTLGLDEGLRIVTDREEAVRAYQAAAKSEANDETEAQKSDDPNNWGWGSDEAVIDEEGPPRVSVAELLVEDGELGELLKDVTKIVERSDKKHVSLRMHFGRQITSEDVSVLTSVRDFLAEKGGQLALVSLQKDVLKWLKLLEFDREFLIAESADDADLAHRRHASGEVMAAPPPKPKPLPAPPKPTPAPAPEGASLAFESEVSLAVDTGGAPSSAELDTLRVDLGRAVSEAAQLKSQVSQLRDSLKRSEEAEGKAKRRAQELDESARRDERRLREIEQARERAEERAKAAESASSSGSEEAQRFEGEVRSLRQQLDSMRSEHDEARGQLQERVNELEAENRLQASQQTASTTSNGGEAELRRRITGLEDEKAKILTEAEDEIQRLTQAHDMLRMELQSAGEMIERLGKELELS